MKRHLNKNKLKKKTLYLLLPFLAFGAILGATGVFSSNSYFSKAESEEIEIKPTQETSSQASSSEVTKTSSTSESSASEPTASSSNEAPTTSEAPVSEVDAVATQEAAAVDANSEQLVVSEVAYNAQVPATPVQQTHYYAAPTSTGVLANGNTAGKDGAYAAAQMAAATGVSQSTWEYIIARESNGQVNARNASGASGLFQTMPGWGSTATVQDQINAALNAYNAQGLSAWGY